MIIVLGATGFLGSYIFDRFKEEAFDVVGTYFGEGGEGLIEFDLASMSIKDLKLPLKPSHIIFTAASNPTPEKSVINLNKSYEINVTKTKKLIDYCFKHNIIPVYPSTDNVFDGKKGNYNEEDETNPLNNYGRMKCEIEGHLFASGKPFILLRLGKVFKLEMNEPTIFTNMKTGDKLKLANDQVFTPLYIEDLFQFIKQAVENNHTGIFHIASCYPTTRYEIANISKNFFNIQDVEITLCSIDDIGLKEPRPKLIDLDVNKYKKITGKEQKPIIEFLKKIKID